MAVDTAEKLLSLLDHDLWLCQLPIPNGGLDQGDKQHVLGFYSGLLASEAIELASGLHVVFMSQQRCVLLSG